TDQTCGASVLSDTILLKRILLFHSKVAAQRPTTSGRSIKSYGPSIRVPACFSPVSLSSIFTPYINATTPAAGLATTLRLIENSMLPRVASQLPRNWYHLLVFLTSTTSRLSM